MSLFKTIAVLATPYLPGIVNGVYEYFQSSSKKIIKHPSVDRSAFTQGMYDFAAEMYLHRTKHNLGKSRQDKINQQQLTDYLNQIFGTHKSVTTMSKLFKGKIDRNTLASGIIYHSKFKGFDQ